MNKFIGIGRLTKDVETRISQSGAKVARYSLALDRHGDGTDFIDCVCFGKTADFAEQYLSKGKKIAIEAHVQTGSYEKDGRKIKTVDFVIDRHEFVESKGASNGDAASVQTEDGFVSVPDGIVAELPFN